MGRNHDGASAVAAADHGAITAFRKAMSLQARDLYVSSLRLGASGGGQAPVTTVIDIATPIVGDTGERLGVLLFTLDWS